MSFKDAAFELYLFYILTQNNKMKKLIAIYAVTLTLAFGIASPAFAQHCDVQKGDSMWRIAKRYHVLFEDVLRLNRHFQNQNMIHPRQEVQLPNGSEGNETSENSTDDNIQSGNQETTERGESSQATEVLKLVNQERKRLD